MYHAPAHGYAIYVCRAHSRGLRCDAPAAIKMEWADEYATREFLEEWGDFPVVEHVTHPGYDPRPELEEIEAELRDLYATKDARESVATLRALEERAARLPLDELREAQFRHDAMAVERIVPELRRSAEGRTASDGQGVLTSKLSTSTSPPRAWVAWLKTAKR
jgi:hypothetical protein